MAKVEVHSVEGISAGVTAQHELLVINAPYPPLSEQRVQPFRQYLTVDGLSTGSHDMGIDGSSTAVPFYIPANASRDRHITSLNFLVGYGSSGQPFQWANGTALTNGMRLFYVSRRGEYDIHEAIKTNQDMFRLSFSPLTTAWELRGVGALNDFGYFISMDLTRMGLPFGIKLDAGSTQQLACTVRDNAGTDADIFDVIAYGFERF